ncbi:MAG: hypothetical protein ACE5EY_01965 [Anaerolineae bacterium]
MTQSYDFARSFYDGDTAVALFLQAERQANGVRPFKLHKGEPLPISYEADLYKQVFGKASHHQSKEHLN